MQADGEESDEDFRSLLGECQIVEPTTEYKAHAMFEELAQFFELLANGPCIVDSTCYTLAAELIVEYNQDTDRLMMDTDEPYFLL